MLDLVSAVRFDKRMGSGKTMPILLECERDDGRAVEAVTKLSGRCERGVGTLVAEAIAALLAADLDLPVPEPFLVRLTPEFVATLTDPAVRENARKSSSIGFGSKKLPPGFATWPPEKPIPRSLRGAALEIFAFDALIQNADRRPDNANCLCDGSSFAIFDHELTFLTEGIIGWRPPWETGALEFFRHNGGHLFFDRLRGGECHLARLAGAWEAITDARLMEYEAALPPEWSVDGGVAKRALVYIGNVRDNIEPALAEIARVLK